MKRITRRLPLYVRYLKMMLKNFSKKTIFERTVRKVEIILHSITVINAN